MQRYSKVANERGGLHLLDEADLLPGPGADVASDGLRHEMHFVGVQPCIVLLVLHAQAQQVVPVGVGARRCRHTGDNHYPLLCVCCVHACARLVLTCPHTIEDLKLKTVRKVIDTTANKGRLCHPCLPSRALCLFPIRAS